MKSSDAVIKVENISKCYRIGLKEEMYENFAGFFFDLVRRPLKNYRKYRSLYKFDNIGSESNERINTNSSDIIWALRDVSFEVKKGEVIGIIGKNGSGKSTLLKILSKITAPTYGAAGIQGRVSSLLEVGTGFHPELTGRENVYLNGTILGMTKKEVDKKFDEIVEFSGVEKFLDTPVKRYSSGMVVRLAFSVAAHLEPEILVVDEVLAVGDVAFQEKCQGKMGEVAKGGRTIVFVSHNMGAIQNLCTSGIWLDSGKIVKNGEVKAVVNSYLKNLHSAAKTDLTQLPSNDFDKARITEVRLLNFQGNPCDTFSMGETIILEFDVKCYQSFRDLSFSLEIKRKNMGINVLHMTNSDCGISFENISRGEHSFRIKIPNCMLYPASYQISIWVGTDLEKTSLTQVRDISGFSMVQSDVTRRTNQLSIHREAIFYIHSNWKKI